MKMYRGMEVKLLTFTLDGCLVFYFILLLFYPDRRALNIHWTEGYGGKEEYPSPYWGLNTTCPAQN
jgi:hypothetical protein